MVVFLLFTNAPIPETNELMRELKFPEVAELAEICISPLVFFSWKVLLEI